MQPLTDVQTVDSVLSQDTAILYKHSTRCPISASAHVEMEQFVKKHPDAPVYIVDVNDSAEVSSYIAEETGIAHDSPQLILVRGGTPAWHTEHFSVTAEALEQQLGMSAG